MKRKLLTECYERAMLLNKPEKHPDWGCYHHFSFLIQDNKIIGHGMNRRGDPIKLLGYQEWGKIHSEYDVYQQVKGIMEPGKFSVVNFRLSKKGLMRDSTPCKCCSDFLGNMGCTEIWFSTSTGHMARMGL